MTAEREPSLTPTEATLTASRALAGIVARSLATALDDLSFPQLRVLVVLDGAGAMRMGDLAERTGVHASTLTRMVDRIEAGGWVRRDASPDSRREVIVALSDAGQSLVNDITRRRRRAISQVLRKLDPEDRAAVHRGMEIFANAAGEPRPSDLLVLGVGPDHEPTEA